MVSFEQNGERIALQVELEAKERDFQRTEKQIGQLIKEAQELIWKRKKGKEKLTMDEELFLENFERAKRNLSAKLIQTGCAPRLCLHAAPDCLPQCDARVLATTTLFVCSLCSLG